MESIIIFKELFKSGVASDGRVVSRDYVLQLYKNTKRNLKDKSLLVPMKMGHEDADETLKGKLLGVKLKRSNGNLTIVGKFELFEPLSTLYKHGQLPALSVEIYDKLFEQDGTSTGIYIGAIALLGTTPASFPDLKEEGIYCNPFDSGVIYYSFKKKRKFQKGAPMPQLQEIRDALGNVVDMLDALLSSDELPEEEPTAELENKTDSDPEFAKDDNKDLRDMVSKMSETLSKITEKLAMDDEEEEEEEEKGNMKNNKKPIPFSKIQEEFAKLSREGKVAFDEKERFVYDVNQMGLDTAVNHYRQEDAPKPPMKESKAKSKIKQFKKSTTVDHEIKLYKSMGLTHEEIADKTEQSETYVASILKKGA